MAIKLHRCPVGFLNTSFHGCYQAQKALDEAGVDYEVAKQPALRWNRKEIERRTGQRALPVLELEDGTMLREESADLARRVREGRLSA